MPTQKTTDFIQSLIDVLSAVRKVSESLVELGTAAGPASKSELRAVVSQLRAMVLKILADMADIRLRMTKARPFVHALTSESKANLAWLVATLGEREKAMYPLLAEAWTLIGKVAGEVRRGSLKL